MLVFKPLGQTGVFELTIREINKQTKDNHTYTVYIADTEQSREKLHEILLNKAYIPCNPIYVLYNLLNELYHACEVVDRATPFDYTAELDHNYIVDYDVIYKNDTGEVFSVEYQT